MPARGLLTHHLYGVIATPSCTAIALVASADMGLVECWCFSSRSFVQTKTKKLGRGAKQKKKETGNNKGNKILKRI
jgi:hypothetical protein